MKIVAINILLVSILCFTLFSCNYQKPKNFSSILLYDSALSSINSRPYNMAYDSVAFDYYGKDSIIFRKEWGHTTKSKYININNSYYEVRELYEHFGPFLGIDTIKTFSLCDTVFHYYNRGSKGGVLLIDFSRFDCTYKITRDGNVWITEKQNLDDTSYKEYFYYDENFRIFTYVEMFRQNECVYTLASQRAMSNFKP